MVGVAGAADRLGPAAPATDDQHYGCNAAQKRTGPDGD
jgi:hypothetical protein